MMREVWRRGARGGQVRDWVVPTAHLLGIGWFFATCIILGVATGRWLDGRFDSDPILTLVGIAIGLAVALVGGFRMLIPFINRFGNEPPE